MDFDPLDPNVVRARLAEFQQADPKFEVSGAYEHRYTLGPPLPEISRYRTVPRCTRTG